MWTKKQIRDGGVAWFREWGSWLALVLAGGMLLAWTVVSSDAVKNCGENRPNEEGGQPTIEKPTPIFSRLSVRCLDAVVRENDKEIVALSTVAIAWFTLTLWWTTRRTLRHLEREFTAEHRPWISVKVRLTSDLTWTTEGHAQFTLDFALKNTGRSPAMQVNVIHHVYCEGPPGLAAIPGFLSPVLEQARIAEMVRGTPERGAKIGTTIFPGEDVVQHARIGVAPGFDGGVLAAVVGCVAYRFAYDQTWHQSGFIFQLGRFRPQNPDVLFAVYATEGTIPTSGLLLRPTFFDAPTD